MTEEAINRRQCEECNFGYYYHAEGCSSAPPRKYATLGNHVELLRATAQTSLGQWIEENYDPISDDALAEQMRKDMGLPAAPPSKQMVLSSDSNERKATPIYSGVIKYFPRALAMVARLSLLANEKHNPGEPLGWSEHKSNDHADAAARHLVDLGTIDPEFDLYHDVGFAWRALANLETFLKQLEKEQQ